MITPKELSGRRQRCQDLLQKYIPDAGGILIFSRINIYYFSGTITNGLLWLPAEGEPALFCRKGVERARMESPLSKIFEFRNFNDIAKILRETGTKMTEILGAEMNGISWGLAGSLQKHLKGHKFIPADRLISFTRAIKSEFELEKMREAGTAHDRSLTKILPGRIKTGMSEFDISCTIMEIFLNQGHIGPLRMSSCREEVFLGHTSVGENANYPGMFNGPVGVKGVHESAPCMGSKDMIWEKRQILTIDNGFNVSGYQTDKTVIYWAGMEKDIPAHVREAHDLCLELQQRIADQLKPGAVPQVIWDDCMDLVSKRRWQDGFMGLGKNKVNFAGHGIGLAIDEWPVIASGFKDPLEEGMTLALEPKIGIPGIGMVGTENTFEVTATGGKSITGSRFGIICLED